MNTTLPSVDFCGLSLSRLVIGANPFGGFSHQNPERDRAMRAYHTPERILETWRRARDAGITGFVANNETPAALDAMKTFLAEERPMRWIAQVAVREKPISGLRTTDNMFEAIDTAVRRGCSAFYIQGGVVDRLWARRDEATLRTWVEYGKSKGVPVGVAGHDPAEHLWIDAMDLVDFHAVPFFNCDGIGQHWAGGTKFSLDDVPRAIEAIRAIRKPCIAYKVLGAGRLDARMGLEYAYRHIKPGDIVNLGMHRGDKDGIVEENAEIVRSLLS